MKKKQKKLSTKITWIKPLLVIIFFILIIMITIWVISARPKRSKSLDSQVHELITRDEIQSISVEIPVDWETAVLPNNDISFKYPESIDKVFVNLFGLDKDVGSSLHPNSKSVWLYYAYKDANPRDYGYILSIFSNPDNLSITSWWNSTFSDKETIKIPNRSPKDYQLNYFTLNDEEIMYFSDKRLFYRGYIKKVGSQIVILELNTFISSTGPTLDEEFTLPLLASIKKVKQ